MTAPHTHRALADCPVCGDALVTTRLGCSGCGTELVGQFAPCPFCALDDADLEALKVFLVSRGNLKELQSHLGVSYPTARARFNDLLERLDWLAEAGPETIPDADVAAGHDPAPTHEDAPAEEGVRDGEPGEDGRQPAASETPDGVRDQVLAQVAAGTLSPAVAADLLSKLR